MKTLTVIDLVFLALSLLMYSAFVVYFLDQPSPEVGIALALLIYPLLTFALIADILILNGKAAGVALAMAASILLILSSLFLGLGPLIAKDLMSDSMTEFSNVSTKEILLGGIPHFIRSLYNTIFLILLFVFRSKFLVNLRETKSSGGNSA